MSNQKINIITGNKHSGKTAKLLSLIKEMRLSGKKVSGIISRGTFKNDKRNSFFVQDVSTGQEKLLMSTEPVNNSTKIGKFYINNEAFSWGKQVINRAILSDIDVIVIDEIGRLEIDNGGWADIIPMVLRSEKEMFFIVREEWLKTFVDKFNIQEYNHIKV